MPGHDWPGGNAATEPVDDRAPSRHRELITALEWLPVASLILAGDGTVLAANRAWDDLVGPSSASNSDQDRGAAVWPAGAGALRARLQAAAANGGTGSADVRLTGASRTRWSRWWWQGGPAGCLIVCAGESGGPVAQQTAGPGEAVGWVGRPAVTADGPPGQAAGDAEAISDTLGLVVHRLFGIGLGLQSVTSHADDVTAQRLQHMLDQLDDLIDYVRSAAFSLGRRPRHR